ncbi:heparan sulfate 2-O-sulfotransferase pipe-like [Penaeus japonicus]|uniref:heparan sulfate 2-O-sulfotransferase pipe-like n=1 Tax=Penaeus japonicus TaxID=27405 RepID=UPI001C7159D7|nr:heparan sulfate 2-O-sulfotransferase pipe-like [Penaeus japonicus]
MYFTLKWRRWRNSDNASTIIGIIRYIPYVACVISLKIYVLMLLVHKRDYSLDYADYDDYSAKGGSGSHSSSQIQPTTTTQPEDPFWDEKQRVLARLNDTVLQPTSFNRTPDTIWLFYNRIPRAAGQTVVSLLKSLSADLDYQHQEHVYRTPWQRLMSEEEQRNLATWFEYNFWPKTYDRFSLFINFTQHRSPYVKLRPAYMTVARDPVDKFVSYFRFKRVDHERVKTEMSLRERQQPGTGRKWYWKKLEDCVLKEDPECDLKEGTEDFISAIPFLCGQHDYCIKHGNSWALQKAKFNAEYEYSVVGLVEHWNMTLAVLEHFLPSFFQGVQQRYWDAEFKDQRTVNKNPKKYKPVSETVLKVLKNKMAHEYELYEFLKQRLFLQYKSIADLLQMPTTKIHSKSTEKSALSSWDRMDIELRH